MFCFLPSAALGWAEGLRDPGTHSRTARWTVLAVGATSYMSLILEKHCAGGSLCGLHSCPAGCCSWRALDKPLTAQRIWAPAPAAHSLNCKGFFGPIVAGFSQLYSLEHNPNLAFKYLEQVCVCCFFSFSFWYTDHLPAFSHMKLCEISHMWTLMVKDRASPYF